MDSHSNLQVPNCGPLTAFWPCASSDSLWSWQFEQSPSILLQFERKGAANRPQPTPYQFCGLSPRRRQLRDRIADFPSEAKTVNSRVFLMQELPLMLLQHKMSKSWIKIIWLGSLVLVWRCWFFDLNCTPGPHFPLHLMFPKYSQRQKHSTQNNWQIDRHPGRCPAELWRWPNHGDQTCRPHLLLPLQCYNQEDELRDFLDFLGIQTCEILSPMSNSVSSLSFPKKVSLLGRPKRYPWFCKKEDRKRKGKERKRKGRRREKEQTGKGRGKERERKRKEIGRKKRKKEERKKEIKSKERGTKRGKREKEDE